MKIAIYIPDMRGGGIPRKLVRLAKGLAEHVTIQLVVGTATGHVMRDVPEDMDTWVLGKQRVSAQFLRLIKYLKKNRPDVLITAMWHSNIAAIFACGVTGRHTQAIITANNRVGPNLHDKDPLKDRLLLRIAKYVYPRADAIIANSEAVAQELVRISNVARTQITVIPIPAILPDFKDKANEPVRWPTPAKQKGRYTIVAVGRVELVKDYKTLIEAFAIVRKQIDAYLCIVGNGSERTNIERLVTKKFLWGYTDFAGQQENVYNYMAQADVFVLSSIREGGPVVLIEALAAGTKIVSTDCGIAKDMLGNGKFGRIVPIGNPQAMATAIIETVDIPPPDPKTVDVAISEYKLHNVVSMYLALFEGITRHKSLLRRIKELYYTITENNWRGPIDWDARWSKSEPSLKPDYRHIVNLIKPDSTVLDVGCGAGTLLEYLRRSKPMAYLMGLDKSRVAVEACNAKGIDAVQASAQDVPFSRTWDYIVLCHVLEHIADPGPVLQKICAHARRVIISVPNTGFFMYRLRMLFGRLPYQGGDHIRYWTLKNYPSFLRQYGLEKNISFLGGYWRTRKSIREKWFPNLFMSVILCELEMQQPLRINE